MNEEILREGQKGKYNVFWTGEQTTHAKMVYNQSTISCGLVK